MRRISILLFTFVAFLVSGAWPQSDAPKKEPTIITVDPPGSIYTLALAINPSGAIAGWYIANNMAHGFLRAKDGTFTSFDAPGLSNTFAYNINPSGAVTGDFIADDNVFHRFLRAPDGTITTFDAPGAGTGTCQGT